MAKKANLDQLNFALETQSKLNEAFSSASRICRFCWDSEGILKDDKFIIWTIQNINTALDVFKWENNSENITIIQNGVYRIVFGLIGLEKNKNFGISFNDDENIIINSKKNDIADSENENDINNEKGNVKYLEKYIACAENTKIKAIIFDTNNNDSNYDNSEEAFLEITKIIILIYLQFVFIFFFSFFFNIILIIFFFIYNFFFSFIFFIFYLRFYIF